MLLKFLFYCSVAFLVLGQFVALARRGDASIYAFDLAVGLFVLCGIVYFLVKRSLVLPKYAVFYVLFSCFALASLVFNSQYHSVTESATALLYWGRWCIYLLSAVVLYSMLKKRLITVKEVVYALAFSGLFLALAGFAQLVILPDFETLNPTLGWDPHKNRLASTFFDPNFTGAYLVLILGQVIGAGSLGFSNRARVVVSAIMVSALLLTFSRSAWLMLALVALVFCILRRPKMLLVPVILVFLAYYAVPRVQTRIAGITDPADSARFRLISWRNAGKIISDNYIIGVGFNLYKYVQKDYGFIDTDSLVKHSSAGADSSSLFIWATTGIFGFITYLLGFCYPAFSVLKKSLQDNYDAIILALTLGLLVESQFINSLFYPQIQFALLAIFTTHQFFRTEP